VLLHHNITPPEFFAGFDAEMVRICELGQRELGRLRGHVDLALADSEFNRRELEDLGFERSGVLPICLDFARYRERANPVLTRMLGDGLTNVLFVGRIAPNKRHDDLIRVAAYWKRFIGPDVRFVLVGKLPRRRVYFDALVRLARSNALTPWDVLFTGHVAHDELLACYRSAHLFLSMSAHEGFGVPLVEAMLMDVPILASRCTAVADTLGDAGVQFDDRSIAEIAEMGRLLATDARLRETVLAGQRRRLEAFAPAAVEARLKAWIESL
jgi:glycosyltransferase involved in cell wall biosynthesis